jgi:folate-binding protein YgfZ
MESRGLLEVRGEDRIRWLDGMVSGDIEALEKGESGSGCYAMLLTNRGAIVADLHIARIGDVLVLELLRSEIPRVRETLEKFIIADDVELVDRSADQVVLGIEGPEATLILEAAITGDAPMPDSEDWGIFEIAGRKILVGAFGFSGELGFQLRFDEADRGVIEEALDAAAGAPGIVRGDAEALEILRVEAGIPALGQELDEEVLPPEARLERAISTSKGCYVGQEIVARLRARGQVNHLLVGLKLDVEALPEVGTALSVDDRTTGELTSIVDSPSVGPIALGYVRREHADPGTQLAFEGGHAVVAELPLVPVGNSAPSAGSGTS